MTYRYFTEANDDFRSLSDELNAELQLIFGTKQEKYLRYNLLTDIKDIVLCYDGATPIGCISIKKYDESAYEIKRLFVKKEYRGKGVSKDLLAEIEAVAIGRGAKSLVLETGERLAAAISLYQSHGYRVIANYGQYENMRESICMRKELVKG